MINRNSGIRGRTRTDEERQPKTEIVTSRKRDDFVTDNDIISTVEKNGIEERLSGDEGPVKDLSLVQEVVNGIWYIVYGLGFRVHGFGLGSWLGI